LDGLIGFFINALALRTDLSAIRHCDLLARVRATCLDAYSHQDLPLSGIVEEINPERDLGRAILIFQGVYSTWCDIGQSVSLKLGRLQDAR
jgi:non-ribosomal peptide synthetase component F